MKIWQFQKVNMAAVDDVYESWEDMDDIVLDRKITNFLASTPQQRPQNSDMISNGSVNKVFFDMNDAIEAQFMVQQPTVKILKRPVGLNASNSNGECKTRPVKTLQQRQQEYEQARLRILGEARSPEDIAEETITNLQLKMESNSIKTINRIKEKPAIEILSPKISIPAHVTVAVPPAQQRIVIAQPPNLITLLRSPRGPDGTKGFNLQR